MLNRSMLQFDHLFLTRHLHHSKLYIYLRLFRILVEFVREPDPQLGYLAFGWLTMGQVLSVPMILFGVGLIVWAKKKKAV